MKSSAWLWTLGAAALALLLPTWAQATIIIPRSLEQMSVEASAVVRAKVVQRQASWDADHRRIHTYTELQVLETVHHTKPLGSTLVVRTMGGEVGDIGMRVAGVARFEVGEEVLVFLRDDPLDPAQFQVVGMSQGKYRIDRSGPSPVAVPSLDGLAFARPSPSGTLKVGDEAQDIGARRPLVDLIAQVKAALRTASATPPAPAVVLPTAPTAPTSPAATTDPVVAPASGGE